MPFLLMDMAIVAAVAGGSWLSGSDWKQAVVWAGVVVLAVRVYEIHDNVARLRDEIRNLAKPDED